MFRVMKRLFLRSKFYGIAFIVVGMVDFLLSGIFLQIILTGGDTIVPFILTVAIGTGFVLYPVMVYINRILEWKTRYFNLLNGRTPLAEGNQDDTDDLDGDGNGDDHLRRIGIQ